MDQNHPRGLEASPAVLAVIGLVILACVLTVFLCFTVGCSINARPLANLQLRLGFRWRTQRQSEDRVDGETPSSTFEHSMVHLIPVRKYATDGELMGVNDEAMCAVCLGEFIEGVEVKILPKCKHSFHAPCIDVWLFSHSSCPLCRREAIAIPTSQLLQSLRLEISRPPLSVDDHI